MGAQPIVLSAKVVNPFVAVLVSRLDVNPVDTRPPSVGAAGHEAHTEVDVAHVVDENEPALSCPCTRLPSAPSSRRACPRGSRCTRTLWRPRRSKEPASHSPVQAAVVRLNVEPYLPAGHGVKAAVSAPPVEYEPGGALAAARR